MSAAWQRSVARSLTVVVLVGLGWWLWEEVGADQGRGGDPTASSDRLEVGAVLFGRGQREPAPRLSGRTLDGDEYDLRDDTGHVVVVNVWGSWCGPCREETPDLVRLARAYEARGVRFVGVDTRDNAAAANAFVRAFDVPYPSVVDDGTVTLQLRGVVPTSAVPSTIVVDGSGRVAARVIGRVTYRTLKGILDEELS